MPSITSTVIGPLHQDTQFSDWWRSGEIPIPFFSDTKLSIIFMDFIPENDAHFIKEADAALTHFLALSDADRLRISDHIYKDCTDFLELVECDEEDRAMLEQITNPHDIWKHVHLQEISISRRRRRDKDIYILIMCDCDWEIEHGLQLVFRQGKQLTRVSTQDCWLTRSDAYDTADSEDPMLSAFTG